MWIIAGHGAAGRRGPRARPPATSDRCAKAVLEWSAARSFEESPSRSLAGTGALARGALARRRFLHFRREGRAALEHCAQSRPPRRRCPADVRASDALHPVGGPWHLVFLDPPYDSGLGQQAVANLVARGALAPGALLSLETGRRESVEIAGLKLETERVLGKAKLTLLRAPA